MQYVYWVKDVAQGDFGTAATFNNTPVLKLVKQRLWTTVQLQGLALLISLSLAIPIGIISATRQYSALDNIVTVGSFLGSPCPISGWRCCCRFGSASSCTGCR